MGTLAQGQVQEQGEPAGGLVPAPERLLGHLYPLMLQEPGGFLEGKGRQGDPLLAPGSPGGVLGDHQGQPRGPGHLLEQQAEVVLLPQGSHIVQEEQQGADL